MPPHMVQENTATNISNFPGGEDQLDLEQGQKKDEEEEEGGRRRGSLKTDELS